MGLVSQNEEEIAESDGNGYVVLGAVMSVECYR